MKSAPRTVIAVLGDAILVNAALFVGLALRFDGRVPLREMNAFAAIAPGFTVVSLVVFRLFGLYRRLWKYASIGAFMALIGAVTTTAILLMTYVLLVPTGFPRSVILVYWFGAMSFLGAVRFGRRCFNYLSLRLRTRAHVNPTRVLVIGAGIAGSMVVREMITHPELGRLPVGLLDDDQAKLGLRIDGVPVLGTCGVLGEQVEAREVDEIIIAMPSAGGETTRRIFRMCQAVASVRKVKVRIVPGVYELVDGQVTTNSLREVRIEDLLGREPVELDLKNIAGYLAGRRVLVTGAGGSIGSELCRQVAHFEPESLVLLGHGENSIFEINLELSRVFPKVQFIPVIADVQDAKAIESVFAEHRPQVVFHAAAHKHVPLMELHPLEAIKNNVFGTQMVAEAAVRWQAERFVLISTDKAVNPKSVMGATKRVAESIVVSCNAKGTTRLMAVRFGNVLGSRGSAIPVFQKQIARGGPVTITHPDMSRYFMTIPEAARLVIQAGALGRGQEIFVLDMGEPVKIIDLVNQLITLSGLIPGKDVRIEFTGIRPGEKLSEELLTPEEETNATGHQRIFVTHNQALPVDYLAARLLALRSDVAAGRREEALGTLWELAAGIEGRAAQEVAAAETP